MVPTVAPLPRTRQTVLDLARRLSSRGFLAPTACLAATTAALAVGVGFLPVRGAAAGLNPLQTGAAISLLATATALMSPLTGRARDSARVHDGPGMAAGLALAATGLAVAALLPGLTGLLVGALLTGAGTGLATPWDSPPWLHTPHPSGSAKPWEPPKSAANSATPADPYSSPQSPPPPPSPAAYLPSPGSSPPRA
jgi:hypothetical protein